MKILLPALAALLIFSCSSKGKSKDSKDSVPATTTVGMDMKPGSYQQLSCVNDPSNAYEVYLPTGFSKDQKYKTVIFFDPHGAGHLPLEKYKSLADAYNYIFV
jgi:hypothetical protein